MDAEDTNATGTNEKEGHAYADLHDAHCNAVSETFSLHPHKSTEMQFEKIYNILLRIETYWKANWVFAV